MDFPACVRLLRPDRGDRDLVYGWLKMLAGREGPGAAGLSPVAALTADAFGTAYPLYYFDHSERERGRLFLVAVGDQPVGTILHGPRFPTPGGGSACELQLWLGDVTALGRGVAAHAVVQLCERLGSDLSVTEVAAFPSARNQRALKAYQRAGFRPGHLGAKAAAAQSGATLHCSDAVYLARGVSPGPAIVRAPDGFDRSPLMALFRLADESEVAILRYRDQGALYILFDADEREIVGQILVCRHAFAASATIESLALAEGYRRKGMGTALVRSVLARLADEGVSQVEVGTAAGDTVNLRFYQYLGFRLRTVQRDFFRPPDYPMLLDPGAIPLRDRVVCDIALTSAAVRARGGPAEAVR